MGLTQSCETEQSEIVVLYCQDCVSGGGTLNDGGGGDSARCKVRQAMLPCGSKALVSHLLKLLESGADGVEVVVCPEGACRHLVGSRRAGRRVEYARRLLTQLGMSAERLGIREATGLSSVALLEIAAERAAALEALGPCPIEKGGGR